MWHHRSYDGIIAFWRVHWLLQIGNYLWMWLKDACDLDLGMQLIHKGDSRGMGDFWRILPH